jgi:hypothetical protein
MRHTRFWLTVGLILLAAVEGCARAFWLAFPVGEVLSFQSGIAMAYLAARTVNNVHLAKNMKGYNANAKQD